MDCERKKPDNVGQASRVAGVTTANILVLLMYLEGVLSN